MPDATDMDVPAFGRQEAGPAYVDRLTAFGIAMDDAGRIATVRIARTGRDSWDLPGGMLDPGETEQDALVREFREETGWRIVPDRLIARARQYTITSTGERRHNLAAYYTCQLKADHGDKIEADHTLVWLDPETAIARMRHEATAWAIAKWRDGR